MGTSPPREKIKALIEQMKRFIGVGDGDRQQRPLMAEIQAIIADEQSKAAEKLERQTRQLVYLTWAIVGLTAVLLFFTMYLYKDAHAAAKREQTSQQHTTEQQ